MEPRLSGFVCEVPVDSSWSVSTYDADGPVMTLYDDSTESAVTLRGEALVGLLETALPELVELRVAAEHRRNVAMYERLRDTTEALYATDPSCFDLTHDHSTSSCLGPSVTITEKLRKERLATPDEMEPGGWVRLPSGQRWYPVVAVEPCDRREACRRVALAGVAQRTHIGSADTLPYRTAEEMRAEAPIPSDEGEYRSELRAMARAQGTDTNGTPLDPDAA